MNGVHSHSPLTHTHTNMSTQWGYWSEKLAHTFGLPPEDHEDSSQTYCIVENLLCGGNLLLCRMKTWPFVAFPFIAIDLSTVLCVEWAGETLDVLSRIYSLVKSIKYYLTK